MLRSLPVLAVLALLAGCGHGASPTADPIRVSPAPPAVEATSSAVDGAGLRACGLVKQAIDGATLMSAGVVDAIRAASSTADAPVADSAARLAAAYATALTTRGTEREPDAVAAVSAQGAEMRRVCVRPVSKRSAEPGALGAAHCSQERSEGLIAVAIRPSDLDFLGVTDGT